MCNRHRDPALDAVHHSEKEGHGPLRPHLLAPCPQATTKPLPLAADFCVWTFYGHGVTERVASCRWLLPHVLFALFVTFTDVRTLEGHVEERPEVVLPAIYLF